MGAPRYLKVCLMSIICFVAVLAATNSEPYVAVSTVACFLEYQSTGVLFNRKCFKRTLSRLLAVALRMYLTLHLPLFAQSM